MEYGDICRVIKNTAKYIKYVYFRITFRMVRIIDGYVDLRICGKPLTAIYATNIEGGTRCNSTCYWTLKEIFANSRFTKDDSLVDVGCGQGRLFAFLIKHHFPGKMTGIEYHTQTADYARSWIDTKYPDLNIRIINGDAFAHHYDEYNVFYLFNPFTKDYFIKFVELIESQLTHPIKLYFMTDQGKWQILDQRPGWNMQFRRKNYRKYCLYLWGSPQYYSFWNYTPVNH